MQPNSPFNSFNLCGWNFYFACSSYVLCHFVFFLQLILLSDDCFGSFFIYRWWWAEENLLICVNTRTLVSTEQYLWTSEEVIWTSAPNMCMYLYTISHRITCSAQFYRLRSSVQHEHDMSWYYTLVHCVLCVLCSIVGETGFPIVPIDFPTFFYSSISVDPMFSNRCLLSICIANSYHGIMLVPCMLYFITWIHLSVCTIRTEAEKKSMLGTSIVK